jgi:myosin heavy subunit
MSNEWFYLPDDSDDKQGPFTTAELKIKFDSKVISSATYVWNEKLPEWKEIKDLPLLKKLQQRPAPAIPSKKGKTAPSVPKKKGAAATKSKGAGETKSSTKASKKKVVKSSLCSVNQRLRPSRVVESDKHYANGWSERTTVDGMMYYYNSRNENVSWDKPDELKTVEEKQVDSGNWVWVRDEKEAWLPAQKLDGNTVKTIDGKRMNVKQSKDEPLWELKRSALRLLVDDLVMLDDPNEAAIVYNLRERFRENKIYTWVGASKSVLVSVNPFKMLPFYGPDAIQDYMHPGPTRGREPHVFSIANSSFRTMQLEENNHAILISGESGAGKTEATKQVLSFLADAAGSEDNVEQRILMANPVLEAYGNAKTLRNNNSSRFGKWIEVHFNQLGRAITSASIENFLLEKSRVVRQQKNERNYHIFYQLCESGPRNLNLEEASDYRYLNGGECIRVKGMDDAEEFTEVEQAMKHLGFTKDEKNFMYSLTTGILTLGNINFDRKTGKGNNEEMLLM